jgi:hypothetical protein
MFFLKVKEILSKSDCGTFPLEQTRSGVDDVVILEDRWENVIMKGQNRYNNCGGVHAGGGEEANRKRRTFCG